MAALRTAAVRSGAAAVHRQTQPRERRRYDEYDDDPPPRKNKKQTVIIVAAALVAGVLAITLLRSILTSFIGATPQDYPVKNLVGMTVEKARELARMHCEAAEQALNGVFSGPDADFLRETSRKPVNRTH